VASFPNAPAQRTTPRPQSTVAISGNGATLTLLVGVNGFGRIGPNLWQTVDAQAPGGISGIEIVALNDLTDNASSHTCSGRPDPRPTAIRGQHLER
jgi:hypothetical protein